MTVPPILCQEASPASGQLYVPCGNPAAAVVWSEVDNRHYTMCSLCAQHNARRRGCKIVAKWGDAAASVAAASLFLPLRSEFYDAFVAGTKDTEYRKYGKRWNDRTCTIGRPVTLSKGYGKQHRRSGVVIGFELHRDPLQLPGWRECYGDGPAVAACIRIHLDPIQVTE